MRCKRCERIEWAEADGARCPFDEKPLVTTAWNGGTVKMVYFLCRACARIGAIGYASDDPSDMRVWFFTGDYYGVSIDPLTQDVWFGGLHRTTRFKFATSAESSPL